MIKKLHLKNFKNFKDAELALGPFTVLIGENASGKSNLRDAFRFLHGIGLGYSLADIFGEKRLGGTVQWQGIRGGIREQTFLKKKTFELHGYFDFGQEQLDYRIEIEPDPHEFGAKWLQEALYWGYTLVFDTKKPKKIREVVKIPDGVYVLEKTLVEHTNANFDNKQPILTQLLEQPLALDLPMYAKADALRNFLKKIRFFEFKPEMMRLPTFPGQTILGSQGENLSSVLFAIDKDSSKRRTFLDWLCELTPMDVVDFEFVPDQTGRILVNLIEQNGNKISAYSASDGTLRFLGILAAFFSAESPQLLFFEELETGIHPSRLHLLVQLIEHQTQYNDIQVVATTHSPQLLRLLSATSLSNAALVYRLPGESEAHIKQLQDFPEEGWQIIAHDDVAELFESRWFEIIMDFSEGEPVA